MDYPSFLLYGMLQLLLELDKDIDLGRNGTIPPVTSTKKRQYGIQLFPLEFDLWCFELASYYGITHNLACTPLETLALGTHAPLL